MFDGLRSVVSLVLMCSLSFALVVACGRSEASGQSSQTPEQPVAGVSGRIARPLASERLQIRPPEGPFAAGFYEARRPVQPVAVVRMPDGGHGVAVLHQDGPGVIRLDATGNVVWSRRYGLKTREFSLTAVGDRLVLVGNDGLLTRTGGRPLFAMALGKDGTPGVVRHMGSPDGITFFSTGIVDNDSMWLAGATEGSSFVLKINSNLNVVSQLGFPSTPQQSVWSFSPVDRDRFAVVGHSGVECMVALSSFGKGSLWTRSFEGTSDCSHVAVSENRIGVVGFDRSAQSPTLRVVVLELDGTVVSDQVVEGFSLVHDFKALAGGGFALLGKFDKELSQWIAMLDPNGSLRSEVKVPVVDTVSSPRLTSPVARGVLVQVDESAFAHLDLFGLEDPDRWSEIAEVETEWDPVATMFREPPLRSSGAELAASVNPPPTILRLQVARRPDARIRSPLSSGHHIAELPTGPIEPRSTVVDETEAFSEQVAGLFLRRRWQELDSLVSNAVERRERFANSSWKTRAILLALEWQSPQLSHLSEEDYLGRLDAWDGAVSGTQHAALLRACAWDLLSERGGRDSTSGFRDLASKEFARLARSNPANPEFYLNYMGFLESYGEESETVFLEGMKRVPDYYYLYQYRLGFMRHVWGGAQEDVEDLIGTMRRRLGPELFDEMYARLVHYLLLQMEGEYPDLVIDEDAALRGQRSIVRQFPKSRRDVYRLGALACEFGRRDILQEAFSTPALKANRKLIRDEIGLIDRYAVCRHWALGDVPRTPRGDSKWRDVLFTGHAEFSNKRVADNFLSYVLRIDGRDVGVTALAPLLGSLSSSGLFYLKQPERFSIRDISSEREGVKVSSIRTLPDGRVPSYAVELELAPAGGDVRSRALLPSTEELKLYSPVWIIARDQPEVAIVMSGGLDAPSGHLLLWTRSRARNALLAGAPVVDEHGGVVGTIVGQDESGTLLCEDIASTQSAFENAGKNPDVLFTEPKLPENPWILEDFIWEWRERIPPGTTLCSVAVFTVGTADMAKAVAKGLPQEFFVQLQQTVRMLSFPRGSQFQAYYGIDDDYNLVLAEPPPQTEVFQWPSGPAPNFSDVMDPPFDKWKKELGKRTVEFVVDISDTGKVLSCTVTTQGVPDGFKKDACDAVMRLAYPPGRRVHMTMQLVAD